MFERTGSPSPIDTGRDIVMGHEFCGEVLERGSGPDALAAGTRVCSVPFAIEPPHARLIGFSADRPSGYGQYMVLNEANLVPVPNGLSPAHTALAEPMAVGWHAIHRGRVTKDDVALVVGCGPIGLAVIALGGNDAAIVMPDVDVAKVAEELFWAAFRNNGQICIATKRMYVHRDVDEPLNAALVAYARTVKVGAGSQQGTQIGRSTTGSNMRACSS